MAAPAPADRALVRTARLALLSSPGHQMAPLPLQVGHSMFRLRPLSSISVTVRRPLHLGQVRLISSSRRLGATGPPDGLGRLLARGRLPGVVESFALLAVSPLLGALGAVPAQSGHQPPCPVPRHAPHSVHLVPVSVVHFPLRSCTRNSTLSSRPRAPPHLGHGGAWLLSRLIGFVLLSIGPGEATRRASDERCQAQQEQDLQLIHRRGVPRNRSDSPWPVPRL